MTRYQQLADDLARRIAEGTLRPGERVPSVRHACRSHDASPSTVLQAYGAFLVVGRRDASILK